MKPRSVWPHHLRLLAAEPALNERFELGFQSGHLRFANFKAHSFRLEFHCVSVSVNHELRTPRIFEQLLSTVVQSIFPEESDVKHESGQATIVAVLILPLVLFTLGALLLIAYALSIEAKATIACRTQVARSQAEVARAAQRLMSLNARAIRL